MEAIALEDRKTERMTTETPTVVSRFEANLLWILQGVLRSDPSQQTLELVLEKCPQPPCLSRAAVELIQDTLAKGCVSILARSGWYRERHLRNDEVVEGRLWERHPLQNLSLSFSKHSLNFLIWLTAHKPDEKKTKWPAMPEAQLTMGDLFLLYLVYGILRDTKAAEIASSRQMFFLHGLCRLAYPQDFTKTPENRLPNFTLWMSGSGACILEVLQSELKDSWLERERKKAHIRDWKQMQALGQSQNRILQAFLDTVEQNNRRDLARFLLPTLSALMPDNPNLSWWTENLTSAGRRLADRDETYRAALALVGQMVRLQRWQQEAQLVPFYDEAYPSSQLWKRDWEHWQGDELAQRARSL